jgi:hypothetical protein
MQKRIMEASIQNDVPRSAYDPTGGIVYPCPWRSFEQLGRFTDQCLSLFYPSFRTCRLSQLFEFFETDI